MDDLTTLTQDDLEYACSNDVQAACLQAGALRLGDLVSRMAQEIILWRRGDLESGDQPEVQVSTSTKLPPNASKAAVAKMQAAAHAVIARQASASSPAAATGWQAHVAAHPRAEFLAMFRQAHATLHQLWTAATGREDYNKTLWIVLDNALARFARDASTQVGIGRTEPLL